VIQDAADFSGKQDSLIGRSAHVNALGKINYRSSFLFGEDSPTVTIPSDISKAAFTDPPQEGKAMHTS
jgi:hypothetical protein